jgi:RNA chaperone Hfq
MRVVHLINLQDAFLADAREKNYTVAILLNSKLKLTGKIKTFDQFCITIVTQNSEQVVYKKSIATIALPRGQRFYVPILVKKPETPVIKDEPADATANTITADAATADTTTVTEPTSKSSPSA